MGNRDFGERLRELREKAGLSQSELAGKVGIDYSYLSKIESGVKPPPSEQVIIRLAEVLNADRDELMTLAGKIPSDIAEILKSREALQSLRTGHAQKKSKSVNKKEPFNLRLKELRKQAGLSQRELASRVGIDYSYLSKIESGALPPPSEQVIIRLAEVLNADRDELMTLAGKIPSEVVQMLKNSEALQSLRLSRSQKKRGLANKIEGISMMKHLVNYKMLSRVALPILLVCAIAASLWFASPTPVRALTIGITNPSSGTLGDTYSFTVQVSIQDWDILPVYSVNLEIYNANNPTTYKATCTSLPLPSTGLTSSSKSYSSAQTGGGTVTVSVNSDYGWAWGSSGSRRGYGYKASAGWGYYTLTGYSWGYGYGYSGNQGQTAITYTVVWTSPDTWPEGAYRIKTSVVGDNNTTFTGTSSSFTLEAGGQAGGALITRPAEPGVTDVSKVVTTTGKFTTSVTAQSQDKKVKLNIAKNTIGKTEDGKPLSKIRITEDKDPPPADAEVVYEDGTAVADDAAVIGLPYDFGPDGATFNPAITLTFTYDPDEVPEGATPVIAMWDEDADRWVVLEDCVVDPATNTITASVSHFTTFAILGVIPTEEVAEDVAELEAKISALEAQVQSLTSAAQAAYDAAQADYNAATGDVNAAEARLVTAQADYNAATSNADAAETQVTSLQSDLADAQAQLADAQARVDELEAEGGIPGWVWLIVGLAVAAVAVIALVMVRRRTA